MEKYTIYCTEEQTRKALEFGAPIETFNISSIEGKNVYNFPTAEQMIGWLEEQGFYFHINTYGAAVEIDFAAIYEEHSKSRKEATLEAIDAALEYLKK